MSSSSVPPSPVERLLDLAVYAPIGLALAARDVVPRWAEEGRRRVGAQLSAARAVGRLAVDQGGHQAQRTLRRVAREAGEVLGGLGATAPQPGASGGDRSGSASADAGGTAGTPVHDRPPPAAEGGSEAPGHAGGLPIPGYDTLSASQVVQRLAGLTAEELDAVRSYEQAGRARKTVLLKVAQLRTAS